MISNMDISRLQNRELQNSKKQLEEDMVANIESRNREISELKLDLRECLILNETERVGVYVDSSLRIKRKKLGRRSKI